MFEDWSPTALLVHCAAMTYVAGFLVRDQLILRGLLQLGSVFYIAYYYLEPATPLWDAIAWTAVMFLANAWTIMRILKDKRVGKFDEEDLVIYSAISRIAPGDFRRLMSVAHKETAETDIRLTEEGRTPHDLWFVVSGNVSVEKGRQGTRVLEAPMFIGEIAYLLGNPASATVTISEGSRYARWSASDLRDLTHKNETLGVSLEAAFNRDLAAKVAAS